MTDLFNTLQKETEEAVSEQKVKTFVPTTYHDVEFEPQSPRRSGGEKKLFRYDESLSSLRERGYERHPRPAEVFTLLADSLEEKLTPQDQTIVNDMLSSWGEWLSVAWERQGNILIAYLDPIGLVWDKSKFFYFKQDFQYTSQHVFDITDKNSQEWISLRDFSDDFVEFHYGRKFDDLPAEIQQKAYILLPPEGVIRPAGRGGDGGCGVGGCNSGASRGVRPVPVKKSPVEKKDSK